MTPVSVARIAGLPAPERSIGALRGGPDDARQSHKKKNQSGEV
jgi:hypothetical protein